MIDFNKCTQDELIAYIKADKNSPALDVMIGKYKSYIRSLCGRFNINANDAPEFIADASLGVYSAAVHYDSARGVPFEPYTKLFIKRAFFNSLKKRMSAKNASLTDSIYIEDIKTSFPQRALEVFCEYGDPQSAYIRREEFNEFIKRAKAILTEFEWRVFTLYIDDMSYSQISEKLGRNIKSISNAVYRIRNKLSVINYMNG